VILALLLACTASAPPAPADVRMASADGGRPRPVSECMDRSGAVAAINRAMFRED
jgi:hypothetical protein